MDYRKYQYEILCEDKAHYNFVRGWLEKKGANGRKIRCWGKLPHDGCGSAYVIRNFDDALHKVKRRFQNTKTLLVVVVDADKHSVNEIFARLSSEEHDPVFFVVPKWSIDTWARFLREPNHINALDETASCKAEFRGTAKFTLLGRKLAEKDIFGMEAKPHSLGITAEKIREKKNVLNLP